MGLNILTKVRKKGLLLIVLGYILLFFPVCGRVYFSPFTLESPVIVTRKPAESLFPYGTKDHICSMECDLESFNTTFFTDIYVTATTSFPQIPETNFFSQQVNKLVKEEACGLHDCFVQKISSLQNDHCEEDSNKYTYHYELNLIDSTSNLVSFYGFKFQYSGGAHGNIEYLTRNYLLQDETIKELTLRDLFTPEYTDWLFQYCEDYFKSNRCGYYRHHDDYSWIGFKRENINSFLLTDKGLLLIFQNYVVSGFDDYPATLLIPYDELTSITKNRYNSILPPPNQTTSAS